jgi:probable rRNA maturation factor
MNAKSPEIIVDNRSGRPVDTARAEEVARGELLTLGVDSGELGIAFVSKEEIVRLNREHMEHDYPTDVITFPLELDTEDEEELPLLLGDIMICPEVAEEQAAEHGNTAQEELCLLVIHGVLHIAGYDHETDAGQMQALQDEGFTDLCKPGS